MHVLDSVLGIFCVYLVVLYKKKIGGLVILAHLSYGSALGQGRSRPSDIGRRGRWALIKTVSAKDPFTEEALVARLDLLHAEVAGPEPSPLEVLLAERICSLWILIEALELLVSAQLCPETPKEHRSRMSFLRDVFKWQDSASRRFLSALKTLA